MEIDRGQQKKSESSKLIQNGEDLRIYKTWNSTPLLYYIIGLGIIIWVLGVIYGRAFASQFDGSWVTVLIYILTFPSTYLLIKGIEKLFSLPKDQVLPVITLLCLIALMLDGIAVRFTNLYQEATFGISGFLLWFPGVTLLITLLY